MVKRRRAAVSVRENRDVILESFSPNYKFKDPAKRSGYLENMKQTFNYFENYADYIDGIGYRSVMGIGKLPGYALDEASFNILPVHLNIAYRHVKWDDFDIVLTEQIINRIKNIFKNEKSEQAYLDSLKPGMRVIIVDNDEMMPVTYSEMMDEDPDIEVLTLDKALERAAYWFVDNITDGYAGFSLTAAYFVLAFRLAMLEGDMNDSERFTKERYNKVWGEMYASLLYYAGQKLSEAASNMMKSQRLEKFELQERTIKGYLEYAKQD